MAACERIPSCPGHEKIRGVIFEVDITDKLNRHFYIGESVVYLFNRTYIHAMLDSHNCYTAVIPPFSLHCYCIISSGTMRNH